MSNVAIFCLLRGMCDSMHHTFTTIEQNPEGLYVVGGGVVVEELTPEQRNEYEKCEVETAAMAEYFAQCDPGPRFRTIENAIDYAVACDAAHDASEDLAMFGAPGECYRDTMPKYEERCFAALALAV